ncbi:Mitogen-activated protein kinase kinase 3 [Hondaea fermentalgiana]|uniref:mitogen-activated protein kinase kinase n=1 Tax=Hondaea fermentalgiana TaxID=2315210 RepID=A0A2R5H0J7_9STRA|nr:Mitogen-activated protein kinase kinase 3 [Hondaea fermentalgiana]|eukprot:GBG34291.1 Mitogen-activated protein kinase kinase 3 [Hondaea fermentalgiana]
MNGAGARGKSGTSRPRPNLSLTELNNDDPMEQSFAIQNGHFIRGNIDVSESGITRLDRQTQYHGLSAADVELVKVIGKGMSSQVSLVRHRSGTLMALKVINVYERTNREQMFQEIATLYEADCPALVGFYGAFFTECSISIAVEYMDQGCLHSVIEKQGAIPEPAVAAIAYQALWGLGYLKHEKRVHRDVKPQNILCNSRGEVKLTDFGSSRDLENSVNVCQTFVGTFKYMSPERVQSQAYSYASDIWSLGLVILECLLGEFPYPDCNTYIDMVQTILEAPIPLPPANRFSPEFSDFIQCCLHKDPSQRVFPEFLIGAPWLTIHNVDSIPISRTIVRAWLESRGVRSNATSPSPPPPPDRARSYTRRLSAGLKNAVQAT